MGSEEGGTRSLVGAVPRADRDGLLLVALAALWGSSFVVIKFGVETIPPLTLAAARILLAAVVLYGVTLFRGESMPAGARVWTFLLLIGFFGNGAPFFLVHWGEERIDSALAAILMAVMPLSTVLLVHLFTPDEPLTPAKVMGMVVGFAGIVVLVGPEALGGFGSDVWRQLGVAGGAFCYAVAATITRRLPPSTTMARSAAAMISASVQMVPLALVWDAPWTLAPSAASVWAAVYLALLPTGLAAIIYFHLVSVKGATFVSYCNYLIPVFGVVAGWIVLAEAVTLQRLTALAIILAGIAIADKGRGRVPVR